MMKKLALATLVFALGSVSALAADFNGKWTADVPGRNGNTQTTTFNFTVDATAMTVTGTVSGRMGDMPITNGKVTADTITFDVVRSMNGNSFTISYSRQGRRRHHQVHAHLWRRWNAVAAATVALRVLQWSSRPSAELLLLRRAPPAQ